jgi:hypothetical protein
MAFASGDTIALKLEHKAKTKAVLGELVSKSLSAQLDKFNSWYKMPIGAAEDDEYRRLVSEDNRFLRWWQARLWWLKDPHCYETHKDKLKVVLEELVKSHRDQLNHFYEWFDDWGYDFPEYLEDAEAEQALYLRMVNEGNRYLRAWKASLVWTPPVVHPFCNKCALRHGHVAWCN